MKKCVVCKIKEAVTPDRNDWLRYRVRVCADCHAGRLADDLTRIPFYTDGPSKGPH